MESSQGATSQKIVHLCEITETIQISTVEPLTSISENNENNEQVIFVSLILVGIATIIMIIGLAVFTIQRHRKKKKYKRQIRQKESALKEFMGELSERAHAWKIDWKALSKPERARIQTFR